MCHACRGKKLEDQLSQTHIHTHKHLEDTDYLKGKLQYPHKRVQI